MVVVMFNHSKPELLDRKASVSDVERVFGNKQMVHWYPYFAERPMKKPIPINTSAVNNGTLKTKKITSAAIKATTIIGYSILLVIRKFEFRTRRKTNLRNSATADIGQ